MTTPCGEKVFYGFLPTKAVSGPCGLIKPGKGLASRETKPTCCKVSLICPGSKVISWLFSLPGSQESTCSVGWVFASVKLPERIRITPWLVRVVFNLANTSARRSLKNSRVRLARIRS